MAALQAFAEAGDDGDHEDVKLENKKEKKEGGALGNIITQPDKKIVYNAPFSETRIYYIRLTYYGWRHMTRHLNNRLFLRQVVEPSNGTLVDKQTVVVKVTSYPFELDDEEEEEPDVISFEWTNVADNTEFDPSAMNRNSVVKKTKDLPVEYNK